MIYNLYILALILVPFTAIQGLPFLGELQHVLSSYIFFAIFGLSLFPMMASFKVSLSRRSEKVFGLPVFAILFLIAIGLSFAANFLTIKDSVFTGRSGLEKFFSSTILVVYGFFIAYVTYFLAAQHPWDRLVVKPLMISVLICAVFSVFEMGSYHSGAIASFFHFISGPVYGDFEVLAWDDRLRSVAFEPPDFANTAGYIWPWILGAVLHSKGPRRVLFTAVFLVLNFMIYLSEARTSMVMMSGVGAVFLALWLVLLPKQERGDPEKLIMPVTMIFMMVVPVFLLFFYLYFDRLVFYVVAGENVSNLSRLASMTAAFRMFQDSPILGKGFGQFGFHVSAFMPSWGYYSYEIRDWLSGVGGWPSVYSLYARFGADMGVVGIGMWVGIWLWLARSVLVETMRYRQKTGEIPFAAVPLILSCFCVLLAGVPSDTVRATMIWVNMGLACRYLATMKTWRATLTQKTKESA